METGGRSNARFNASLCPELYSPRKIIIIIIISPLTANLSLASKLGWCDREQL